MNRPFGCLDAALVLWLATTACVPNQAYRLPQSVFEPVRVPAAGPRLDYEAYSLAFIEFDDIGEFWNRTQPAAALAEIRKWKATGDVVVVIFIHGWKNNASERSGNVWGFRTQLQEIAAQVRGRRVIGVYFGWRGAVTNLGPLDNLTFYNRRNTAIRIPGAHMTEALNAVMAEAKRGNGSGKHSLCIVVGHSFGGLVLERALTQYMVGKVLELHPVDSQGESVHPNPSGCHTKEDRKREAPFKPPADLIVFVNSAAPATESKQFLDLLDCHLLTATQGERNIPLFLSVTSKGDLATGTFMPIGQFPSKLTKSFRTYDNPFPRGEKNQSAYYLRSTANMGVLQSHEVVIVPDCAQRNLTPEQKRICDQLGNTDPNSVPVRPFGPNPSKPNLRFAVLRNLAAWNKTPYWVMQMPAEMVPDHGTIFTVEFRGLLQQFLQPVMDVQKVRTYSVE